MTKENKLPIWWILILVPMGVGLTTLFFSMLGDKSIVVQKSLGISQSRMFALLIYNAATGLAVLTYYFLLRSKNLTLNKAGYRGQFTKSGIYSALTCFLIAVFIYPLIQTIVGKFNLPMMWEKIGSTPVQQNQTQDIFLALLTAVILAPLTEDTIFRGYVLEMLNERFGKWTGIFVSSIIFAGLHYGFFGPGMTIYMFFWAILTGYLYVRFKNI
ncbi:MAG: CPBP family intramembrane glutamic endopeptidase, partial [Bacteroidia bacterium]